MLNGKTWMEDNYNKLQNIPLRKICMPGTHDSGMSEIREPTYAVSKGVIVTQVKNIKGQLEDGARFFDLRPVAEKKDAIYTYSTGHYSKIASLGWHGAKGQSFDDIILNLAEFFKTSGRELVTLRLSHAYNSTNDFKDFTQSEWNDFVKYFFTSIRDLRYTKNIHINLANDTLANKQLIPDHKFSEFFTHAGGVQHHKGTIIIIADQCNDPDGNPIDFNISGSGKGPFTDKQFPLFDQYADKSVASEMAENQIGKIIGKNIHAGTSFLLSWTMTQTDVDAVKIVAHEKEGLVIFGTPLVAGTALMVLGLIFPPAFPLGASMVVPSLNGMVVGGIAAGTVEIAKAITNTKTILENAKEANQLLKDNDILENLKDACIKDIYPSIISIDGYGSNIDTGTEIVKLCGALTSGNFDYNYYS